MARTPITVSPGTKGAAIFLSTTPQDIVLARHLVNSALQKDDNWFETYSLVKKGTPTPQLAHANELGLRYLPPVFPGFVQELEEFSESYESIVQDIPQRVKVLLHSDYTHLDDTYPSFSTKRGAQETIERLVTVNTIQEKLHNTVRDYLIGDTPEYFVDR